MGNVKVQARVVRALTNLSVHEGNKPKIATVHGIGALINASLEHGDSAERTLTLSPCPNPGPNPNPMTLPLSPTRSLTLSHNPSPKPEP